MGGGNGCPRWLVLILKWPAPAVVDGRGLPTAVYRPTRVTGEERRR